MLKLIYCALSLLAFGVGLYAAYLWYLASKVSIAPAWDLKIPRDVIAKSPETQVSDVVNNNIMGWVTGVMVAFRKSGALNRRAALWTAVTVAVTSLASLLSSLSA